MLQKVNEKVMLTETAYSFSKKLAQIYIPAVSSLYFGLSAIWGLPATEQIVGTLAVVDTFLGVCLGLSTAQYNKAGVGYDGQIVVQQDDTGKKIFSLELDGDPNELENKGTVSFKVAQGQEDFGADPNQ